MTKKVFYPGSKIIQEGKNEGIAYIIVEGTAKLECRNSAKKMQALLYEEDPTMARRDKEKSPDNRKNNDSLKNLIKNGYTSDTLRSI